MSKEEIKLLELIKFHVNDKANDATKMMNDSVGDRRHFYHGKYMAFNELYSLLINIK